MMNYIPQKYFFDCLTKRPLSNPDLPLHPRPPRPLYSCLFLRKRRTDWSQAFRRERSGKNLICFSVWILTSSKNILLSFIFILLFPSSCLILMLHSSTGWSLFLGRAVHTPKERQTQLLFLLLLSMLLRDKSIEK